MDTTKFDTVARLFGSGITRREALRGLVASAAALTAGGALLADEETAAGKAKRKRRKKNKKQRSTPTPKPPLCLPLTSAPPRTGVSTELRHADRPGATASAWWMQPAATSAPRSFPGHVLHGLWTGQLHQLPVRTCRGWR